MSSDSHNASSSRRLFLKALGATAAALPFYRMLENSFVHAQTGRLPLKFLGFGFYHGTAGQLYARRPGETDRDFALDYAHSPFKPFDDPATYGASFKDRLSILEGFDFAVGKIGVNGEIDEVPMHGSMGLLMTGSCIGPRGIQNASIDQYLAAKYGRETRFKSLQLRGFDQAGFGIDPAFCLSFDASGAPLAPLHDPVELWDKCFSRSIVGPDPKAQAAAARKRVIGASVLDFVAKDIARMNARLAGPERDKLDQHLTTLRGLERRLTDTSESAMCTPPPRRDPEADGYQLDKFADGNVLKVTDFNLELLAEIMVCDLTRFATFLLPTEFGRSKPGSELSVIYDGSRVPAVDGTQDSPFPIYYDFHGHCAHRLLDDTSEAAVMSQRMLAAINRMYFGKIAKLMQRMDQAGLLDSTVIMAGSDGGHAAHHTTLQVPILVAGGANGALKLGRRVVAPGKEARALDWCSDGPLSSHNPILVAIANAFGENLTSYGTGAPEHTRGISSLLG